MRAKIIYTETIKINIPESLNRSLVTDMTMFEVFKKDGEQINTNGFINALISETYQGFFAR